jgi:hypothetical protein
MTEMRVRSGSVPTQQGWMRSGETAWVSPHISRNRAVRQSAARWCAGEASAGAGVSLRAEPVLLACSAQSTATLVGCRASRRAGMGCLPCHPGPPSMIENGRRTPLP